LPLDPEEPKKLALTIKEMGLKYVVITSVDRDDLRTAVPSTSPTASSRSASTARRPASRS
jgi:hypothetical protein